MSEEEAGGALVPGDPRVPWGLGQVEGLGHLWVETGTLTRALQWRYRFEDYGRGPAGGARSSHHPGGSARSPPVCQPAPNRSWHVADVPQLALRRLSVIRGIDGGKGERERASLVPAKGRRGSAFPGVEDSTRAPSTPPPPPPRSDFLS